MDNPVHEKQKHPSGVGWHTSIQLPQSKEKKVLNEKEKKKTFKDTRDIKEVACTRIERYMIIYIYIKIKDTRYFYILHYFGRSWKYKIIPLVFFFSSYF